MFSEVPDTRQIPGEPRRRWFADGGLDLIVWFDDADTIEGFQFCYCIGPDSAALTWSRGTGMRHALIDDGDIAAGGHKGSPILMPAPASDPEQVIRSFEQARPGLPPDIGNELSAHLAAWYARPAPDA